MSDTTTPSDNQDRIGQIQSRLMSDLNLSPAQAQGIISNLMYESGVRGINELHPTVPGSRGGFGWAQWTGPRRDAFEAFAKQQNLDPASDEANYQFLKQELQSPQYSGLMARVRAAGDPTSAAASFFPYESGGAPGLQITLPGHEQWAKAQGGGPWPVNLSQTPAPAGGSLALPTPQAVAGLGTGLPSGGDSSAQTLISSILQHQQGGQSGANPQVALNLIKALLPKSHGIEQVDYDPWAIQRSGETKT